MHVRTQVALYIVP